MTHIITDSYGGQNVIDDDERVLVLGHNQRCTWDWMREQKIPPFGRQFTLNPSPRLLQGARFQVVIELDCYRQRTVGFHNVVDIDRQLDAMVRGSKTPVRKIRANCV